jgi:predicted nucleic-acid-binding protein
MSAPARLIDTNLIIRFLVQDHEKHAKAASKLFEACDRGEVTLVVLPAVLAESVFVLESFYRHGRANIARVLSGLIGSPGVQTPDAPLQLDALKRYAGSKAHFVDCLIAAHAAATGLPVASFDHDLASFADMKVELE